MRQNWTTRTGSGPWLNHHRQWRDNRRQRLFKPARIVLACPSQIIRKQPKPFAEKGARIREQVEVEPIATNLDAALFSHPYTREWGSSGAPLAPSNTRCR